MARKYQWSIQFCVGGANVEHKVEGDRVCMKLGINRTSRFVVASDNSPAWVSVVVKLKLVVLYYSTGTTTDVYT